MAQQNLSIGAEGAGQGESLFSAFTKIESMMTELYTDDAGDVNSITATAPISRDSATGAVTISLTDGGISTQKIADDAVTADKLANSINSEITANTAKVTNATHTGDVTGSVALTIAADAVDGNKIADNVALAGSPTTTTQSAGDNSTKVATTAYADTAVANAIDSAPGALDTLNELAASLNDDANFAGTMTTALSGKLATTAGAVGTANLADDGVTADKLANAINSEIAANTAKTGITSGQASAITANTAKTGISSSQASAITANTAKTGITSSQASAITANTAKTGITSSQASAITANTAKTGITSSQASAITANTAKVTNATHTGDVTGGTALTIADNAVTLDKIADAVFVTQAEGISSNDNDTTLPTSAAVKDYVDNATDSDSLDALNKGDGNFVVGNGSAFIVESGATARTSIGLGTAGHIQFHCLGVGEAASTNSGQIDATSVYAATFGLNADDKIVFTDNTQIDFTVNGNNEMRLEADGDLHVDGDVIAASTTVASDLKLKENINTITGAGDILDQIKGVDFTWKKDGKKSSGVIAQDIEKVMPHLVKEVSALDSDDTHLSVDYNGLIGVLIEAVKDLKSEIEILKNK